ncbi:hypothetical protein [Wenxinia marina]|uniref:Uncharacterized protein n=1 Tax=Wenxinia marina DSM 24838 TaxID=1123501 RepID=A0A0D0PIU4_9RHOB|nr:hypothetical protein [Wenxinia marina]KIQ71296.1 hypothetical protein Wenmar_00065 [Wenxinia marina DSM 24838]GGL73671.1 endonuclease [Wenxinia marina]
MTRKDVATALIDHQGTLYSEAIGATISRNTPQELFHWLIASIMLSARISAGNAVEGAAALREAGLHKIDAILGADRHDLVKVLNGNGYARYDESTADYLRDTARLVDESYDGDLRQMRGDSADETLKRLQQAKGLGKLGASIFAREAQLVWDELYPTIDGKAVEMAGELGLPTEAEDLRDLAGGRERFVRLVAALTRARLEGPDEAVEAAA